MLKNPGPVLVSDYRTDSGLAPITACPMHGAISYIGVGLSIR